MSLAEAWQWCSSHHQPILYQSCPFYVLVSAVSYSLSLSSSKMSTSTLALPSLSGARLMRFLARVMDSLSPLLHSMGSSKIAAVGRQPHGDNWYTTCYCYSPPSQTSRQLPAPFLGRSLSLSTSALFQKQVLHKLPGLCLQAGKSECRCEPQELCNVMAAQGDPVYMRSLGPRRSDTLGCVFMCTQRATQVLPFENGISGI